MIVAIMTTALSGTAWAEKITDYSNIVSGTQYYIGATTGGTDYYLSVNGSSTSASIAGTAVTSQANATPFTFAGSGTSWTIQFESGYYLSLKSSKDNGKVQVVEDAATFTASNQSGKIRLTIGSYSIQKNNSGTQFGSYGNTQTDLWLEPVPTGPITYTVTYNANGATSGTVPTDNTAYSSGATVTVLGNTGSLAKTEYTFDGWNTAADGNGTAYAEGATFNISANTTLYAQWEEQSGDAQWVLTSLADLTSSDVFVIVGDNSYAMTNNNGTSSAPATSAVTITGSTITSTVDANIKWNVSGNATDGYTFYPNGTTTTWLYCTNTNNGVRVGTNNDNKTFKLDNNNYLVNQGTNRYLSHYSNEWRCYGNTNNNPFVVSFYKKVTGGVIPPSITASTNEIAYNETNGSITYSVTNSVEGGVVTAASSESWLTVGTPSDGTIALTCAANSETTARTATVTLTYTYNTNKTVTTNVTVTQAGAPVIYTTIPALFAKATEVGNTETNVNVTFGNWVVSGVSGSNAFVTDNNGNGFIIYKSDHGFAVNDKLSGTVSETPLKLYNGSAEFTNLTASTTGLTVTKDGEITVITNKTIADLGGVNTGAVITLSNLTYDGTNLSDGTNTIKPYNSLYNEMSLTSDKTYNITGVYQQYSNTKEILPRSAADIEEYVAPTHTVTFFVNGVEQTGDEAEVSEGAAITFPATPADVNGKTFMGWTTEEISGTTDTAPTIVTSATMGNADVTYYAVFATSTSGGASDTYSLVSDVNDLSDGDNIILVSTGSYTASQQTHYFTVANGSVNSSHLMDPVDVTITDNQVTSTEVAPITLKAVTGGWKLQMGTEYINIVSTKNQITLDENGAVNTISITSGDATIGTADGSDTRKIYYNPNSGDGRFAYYKSTQKPVSIYKQEGGVTYSGYCTTVAPATESVTVGNLSYATFASDNALDFTGTGIQAFYATVSGTTLTFTEITKVPANTGVLLYADGGATEDVPVLTGAADNVASNVFVRGTGVAVTYADTNQNYILFNGADGIGFYRANNNTVATNRAYIHVTSGSGNGVKSFAINLEDDATGISLMEDGRSQMEDGAIYNLAGQRISKMQKGINIKKKKKVLK